VLIVYASYSDMLSSEVSDDLETVCTPDTRNMAAEISAVRKRKNRGIELKPCHHTFCGSCLAGSIYRNLGVSFNPLTYGTTLAPSPEGPMGGKTKFPMGCPACKMKPDEGVVEIGDTTARLVLGDDNMDEWNQARFMWTQDIMYLLADERWKSRGR